jgi:hypothetical protein
MVLAMTDLTMDGGHVLTTCIIFRWLHGVVITLHAWQLQLISMYGYEQMA